MEQKCSYFHHNLSSRPELRIPEGMESEKERPIALISSSLVRNWIPDLVAVKAVCQTVKPQINHRRRIQRQQLTENQSAHDRNSQRPPQLRASTRKQRQRQPAQQRSHRRHHNRAEAQQAGLKNRFFGRLMFFALRLQSKVD